MADPIPYISLPDEWTNKARCPVCSASPLAVVHRAGAADQMACPRCHSLFEIEEKGPRIHFAALPRILTGLLAGRWVTYAEVRQTVQAVAAQQTEENKPAGAPAGAPTVKAPASPEPSPFTEDMVEMIVPAAQVGERAEQKTEPLIVPPIQSGPVYQERDPEIKDVHTRAKDLYALGNRPDQIKEILSRDPYLDKAEIQAEVDKLSGEDQAKKRRQRTRLWVSIVIELFIIILCVVMVTLWKPLLGILGGGPGKSFVATITANKTVAPLVAPPAVLRETGSGVSKPDCPLTNEQAAALFGGPAGNWYADPKDASWFLVTTTAVTVHVPLGMRVTVVDLGNAGVDTVPGPASVINTKSVVILCR